MWTLNELVEGARDDVESAAQMLSIAEGATRRFTHEPELGALADALQGMLDR